MADYIRRHLRKLSGHKWLVAGGGVLVISLFVVVGLTFGNSGEHNARKTASSGTSINKSTNVAAGSSLSTAAPAHDISEKNSFPTTMAGAPAATVLKTTSNNDGTTTKEIASYQSIPFSSSSQNDANLKRGTTQVLAGQNGTQTIVYSVTYDQNGKEIARRTISSTVTKQPVDQITNIGISDFNLNTDTWDAIEFGEMCSPADYNAGSDGCVGVASDRHFGAIEVSGVFYINCISSTSGVCNSDATVNVQPAIAIQSDNTFSYQGTTYRADPRAGAGMPQPLTASTCSQYGLACGSW